jgi:toxin YoeB
MAKQVVWTIKAQADRKDIFKYWNNRNKSTAYSKKLNEFFKENLKVVSKRPYIGKKTNKENVRPIIIRDYMIFYEITTHHIVVLVVWDCNQDPDKNILIGE